MSSYSDDFLSFFRASSPYIHAHRGKTLVVYLSGEALAHDSTALIHDLALLRSLGLRLIIAYGTRPQVTAACQDEGVTEAFDDGLRITDAATLKVATGVAQQLMVRLQAEFSTGLVNSPMHGAGIGVVNGNFVHAMPRGIINGVDLQFTGTVRRIGAEGIRQQLDAGNIVLLPPFGFSVTGEVFNLSAPEVAVSAAVATRADKLVIVGAMDALPEPAAQSQMTPHELRQHLETLAPDLAGLAEARAALSASQQGISRVHVLSATEPGGLLRELYTRDGCGIMVSRDDYDRFRSATAEDIGGILELLRPLEDEGVLVRRSREQLERDIGEFVVNERDGMIIGCAALHPFDTQAGRQAELACVAVHTDYRTHGRGARLLEQVERQARAHGIRQLFALTTRTTHWFREHGFVQGDISDLPEERKALYNFQRNSRVLIKPLPPGRL
ncbi:MAG: amino-acid N-acetyltransferase [Natronospirillum sp.]|uniref:amino-acid N-acetyltransferase n=1 Tax=Natronospirillum sp. TaxID=2812955 RepID=UPI0025F1F6E5|nr:amino-acid N-acetyltransferase [Natronospirillum sp.]MCH8550521.1 amino-acid N-acetyltransferase [Natronospirillum sp.]